MHNLLSAEQVLLLLIRKSLPLLSVQSSITPDHLGTVNLIKRCSFCIRQIFHNMNNSTFLSHLNDAARAWRGLRD